MKELIKFIKSKCSQEEIEDLVKELSTKEETKEASVPRTWEEYCSTITEGYYIDAHSNIDDTCGFELVDVNENKNVLPTKELAEAFLAMMQLMSLRQAWLKQWHGWEPDWESATDYKYCIVLVENSPKIDKFWSCNKTLSFPTIDMAKDFLECFKDLIGKAKVLI